MDEAASRFELVITHRSKPPRLFSWRIESIGAGRGRRVKYTIENGWGYAAATSAMSAARRVASELSITLDRDNTRFLYDE